MTNNPPGNLTWRYVRGKMRKAPWKDFAGNDLHEQDEIIHPSGQIGKILLKSDRDRPEDQWVVDYGDGIESRLCL